MINKKIVIGFTGKKQSGKTECCKYLKSYTKIGFKDELLNELIENFPGLLKYYNSKYKMTTDLLFKLKPTPIRKLMQDYGTDFRRKQNKNYWVDKWINKISLFKNSVCADDVRFLNEEKAVRDCGGYIIKIIGRGCEKDNHISELEMDSIVPDFVINNNGTFENLYTQLNLIIEEIKRLENKKYE